MLRKMVVLRSGSKRTNHIVILVSVSCADTEKVPATEYNNQDDENSNSVDAKADKLLSLFDVIGHA